jgi:hypothetical protein
MRRRLHPQGHWSGLGLCDRAAGAPVRSTSCLDADPTFLRSVRHLACKAYNSNERITLVTSYRAKDPLVHDCSVLSTIRIISKEDRLNAQWSTYRFKLLADRFAKYAAQLEARRTAMAADYFPGS